MSHPKVLAMVLAGGKGERLFPLTAYRSKPSVPFGGRYRIVDFVLSNLINSHIYSIYLLVQYKSQSLIEHVRQNWVLSPVIRDQFVTVVPPQMRMGSEWFQGTADAIFQNLNLIKQHDPHLVIVFGADHVYRMDIRQMIDFHLRNDAYVTVAARPVPVSQASAFGVIQTDSSKRITGFQEKPKRPTTLADNPSLSYVSMGNYIFSRDVLVEALAKAERSKRQDFGAHVIPDLIGTNRVFAYDFATNLVPGTFPFEENGYWRDVGTIEAYFNANMDMLQREPRLDLYNREWPIHASGHSVPATKILHGDIRNSIIAEGAMIHKAKIRNSVIRTGVVVEDNVSIDECIIMDSVVLRKGCRLKRCIVDKLNVIGEGESFGFDPDSDRFKCHIDSSGISIIPKGGRRMRKTRE